jgi:hypothetical protein
MAAKPKPKPKAKPAPAKARAPASAPAARSVSASAVEHRIAVASVGVTVVFMPERAEQFEMRGAGTVNSSSPGGGTRTTGQATVILRKGTKSENRVSYDPGTLNRNLVFALFLEEADFALFHDVFVKNPGGYDPGLRLWAKTARPLDTSKADSQAALDFGYRLDLVQTPAGPR